MNRIITPSLRAKAKAALCAEFRRRGIQISQQALWALTESLLCSDSEFMGDSDTLLAGLLISGSYTVDILEQAGADRRVLESLVIGTAAGFRDHLWSPEICDPLELITGSSVGGRLLEAALTERREIDTAELLRTALSLETDPSEIDAASLNRFPFDQRRDRSPNAPMLKELEDLMAGLIVFMVGFISSNIPPVEMLRKRTSPITECEDWTLDKQLGFYYREMQIDELEFVISALNSWFVNRAILITPGALCLRVARRCAGLLYGAEHLADAGGDLQVVETGLDTARRLVPARDLPVMALFLHKGTVHAAHFTYRDSLLVPDYSRFRRVEVQGVELYSPRPVPLVSASSLRSFERLLMQDNVSEPQLQNFLVRHPEILCSLGYATAQPHICLYDPDSDKLIPDFILEIPGGGVDILDLKLHTAKVVARSPYVRMSSELVKAVAQLRKYASFFESRKNRVQFEKFYGLTGFKPRVMVVMGRECSFASYEERMEIEEQLGRIRLFTYDDIISYARTRVIDIQDGAAAHSEEN